MSRTPHPHARSSARPVLLLLSVLAVLAMACFPGLAAAEENSGIQYETDVPTVPSDKGSNIPSKNSGNSPDESDAEASGSNSPGGAGSGGGGNSDTGGTGTSQGNQAQGGNDGKASNGSKPAAGNVGEAQSLPTVNSTAAESDDGSSPLVPILIAIVVLAAISIGAYYYRQRRQDSGSTVTPKAS